MENLLINSDWLTAAAVLWREPRGISRDRARTDEDNVSWRKRLLFAGYHNGRPPSSGSPADCGGPLRRLDAPAGGLKTRFSPVREKVSRRRPPSPASSRNSIVWGGHSRKKLFQTRIPVGSDPIPDVLSITDRRPSIRRQTIDQTPTLWCKNTQFDENDGLKPVVNSVTKAPFNWNNCWWMNEVWSIIAEFNLKSVKHRLNSS